MHEEIRVTTKLVSKETVYISKDGITFKNKKLCLEHEKELDSKKPVSAWLNEPSVLGKWYRIDNEEQLKMVQDNLGWNTIYWKDNKVLHGEWKIGKWYASNSSELESYDYGLRDTLHVYSLTEYEKEVDKAIEWMRHK